MFILLTNEIEKIQGYNWGYVLIGILIVLIATKYVIELVQWFFDKFGIQFKGKEREKSDHEILKKTAEEVSVINGQFSAISNITTELKDNQNAMKNSINYLQESVESLYATNQELASNQIMLQSKIDEMEESSKAYRLNDTRNELIKQYRYFANSHTNPMLAWTEIESNSFNGIYETYTKNGGNSYIHDQVKPAMDALDIIPISDVHSLAKLYSSRSNVQDF